MNNDSNNNDNDIGSNNNDDDDDDDDNNDGNNQWWDSIFLRTGSIKLQTLEARKLVEPEYKAPRHMARALRN